MKAKFEHSTPESIGISSRDILRLVDDLENSGSEMHGLIVLRHGKTVAEGWWAPYAPGVIHASQSLSKTFTGTAFGIAMGEGLLGVEDRLIDIFPEYVPAETGLYLNDLKMRHILTMSSGMETMPAVTDPDWKRKFFLTPILHPPGTAYFYNSIACSMVGACIQKKTGLGLTEYLRTRLFDKIGIDADGIRWYRHGDGLENGSGGIVTSTEDNARLIQLYMNGGLWGSERILPEEWVRMATSMQNTHFREVFKEAAPGMGYGGMMWIRGRAYYADGAMGQLSIGFPDQDLVISVNQTCADPDSNRRMTTALFGFAGCAKDGPLPEDPQACEALGKRMKTLALPAPEYAPESPMIPKVNARKCRITEGRAVFFPEDLVIYNKDYHDEVSALQFEFLRGALKLTLESESSVHVAYAGLDGRCRNNCIAGRMPAGDVLLSASWTGSDTLRLEIRWIEVCRTRSMEFRFTDKGAEILSEVKKVGGFDLPPQKAFAPWQ
jgi:CubicO group peptidase (beta-lactamase class C family)